MERVLVICGPTGVGKTKISINLAKKLNGEIINVDSMQIYKEMCIGTAKIKDEEKGDIPHHLLDIYSVKENANVADFQTKVREKIKEISAKNKLPILVGGTGLYVKASLYDYDFAITKENSNKYDNLTNEELYEKLLKVDEDSAKKFHQNNRKRIIRCLEILEETGITKTEIEQKQEHKLLYDTIFLTLSMDRVKLYEKVNQRVDKMFEDGLEEEVKRIYSITSTKTTALQAIGYKEFVPYFQGEISLEDVKETIKKNTRHYVKRQYTWLKNQIEAEWLDVTNLDENDKLNQAVSIIEKRWKNND